MAASAGRTQYQAILDIEYGCRLHHLHERLFRRLRGGLLGVNILCGTAAFATVVVPGSPLAAWFGLAVAIASVADLVLSPGDRARHHDQLGSSFSALRVRAEEKNVAELDKNIRALQAQTSMELESLRSVARNDVLQQAGHSDLVVRETFLNCLYRFLA